MTFPTKRKVSVTTTNVAPGPNQAVVVIPESSRYLAFTFLVTGFDVGKAMTVQGSFNGTNFFDLDSTSYGLAATHFTTAAAPVMFQVNLHTPLPGGLRIVSDDSDLTTEGTVQCMMFKCAYGGGLTNYS